MGKLYRKPAVRANCQMPRVLQAVGNWRTYQGIAAAILNSRMSNVHIWGCQTATDLFCSLSGFLFREQIDDGDFLSDVF